MSDPGSHDALAKEQEREADDLERRADALGEHIEAAKDDLEKLEKDETIATPERASQSEDSPPPEAQYPAKRDEDDERTDQGV